MIARVSSIDNNVDDLQSKADSSNAVLSGTTTINGLVLLNGPVYGINKSMVGLGNVDNTSDASKPISSLTQGALDNKAPLASPTFSGTVQGIAKSMVGLGNVDNTSDKDKPLADTTLAMFEPSQMHLI